MKDNFTTLHNACSSHQENKQTGSGFKKNFSNKILFSFFLLLSICGSSLKLQAQTTLAAGDLVFTAFDATKTVTDDKFSFILLANVSSGTDIFFTDRGYSGSGWQAATATTEGAIKWTTGTALPAGTEVMIQSLSATVSGESNGSITVISGNTAGLSLSHPSGDQIIAFQGGAGDPSAGSVTFIAGIHWNYCPNGYYAVYTTDAGWDNIGTPSSCVLGPNASNVPPGLTGGTNAFWIGFYKPTAPATDIRNYTKGQFNGAGAPFATMAALRTAAMNRNNWIPVRSDDTETSINIPTGYTYVSSGPSISAHPSNRTVCVSSNTTFSVTASGATSYQWQLNSGSGYTDITNGGVYSNATTTTLNITGVTAGMSSYQYRCVVTGSGTTTSNGGTLTVSNITATTSQTNIACNGGTTGSAKVVPSGGISPYTYSWSPSGGPTSTASGLSAGAYTVTITDNIACSTTKNFTITQPASSLSATASKTDVNCNGGNNGTATVSATGGTPAYTYSWSPSGGTAATATGLAAGVYTCTITDANACQTTKTVTVTQPASSLSATASKTDVSCNGGNNGTATVSATGGTPAYTYSWSPSGGTAATATGLAVGTYTCTITDANSCQTTKTVTVTQPTALSATASQTNVSCNGGTNGTATVSVTGGTPSYTYSWSPSGGTSATATGLAVGVYTCTITDANSCQTTKTFTITQPTLLSATASQTNVSCNSGSNGTATVSVTGGTPSYTYSWAPSGGTNATATGLAAGVYTCTITDANTCQITRTVTVTQPASSLSATASQTNVSCNGGTNGTATVSVTGGTPSYTYSWSPSGGTAATASGLAVGVYTCTITDANACQTTKTFTITQPTALSATASQTNVSCNGGTNGTATVSASGGTPSYTYSWSPSGGTAATATGLAVGTYTCTITDANTCQTTKTVTITQPTALSATASQTNVSCNGGTNGTATVNASGGTPSYTYSWSPSGGTSATATGLAAGVYTCTITDANTCQTAKTFTITQPTALSATTSQTNVSCNGGTNATATVSASGGTPSYTYSWSPSGGTAATATGLTAGTYTCTITDANTCQTAKTFTITQPSALSATTSQTNVTCNGGSNGTATVSATGGTGSYTYSWAPSGGTAATATGLTAGTYTVTITDANSCTAFKSFTITQPATLTASATPSSATICSGGTTDIALNSTPSGASFTWTVTSVSGSVDGASSGSGSSIEQTLSGNGVVNYVISYTNGTCSGSPITIPVTVNALAKIIDQPVNTGNIDEHESATFSVKADYANTYQWQVNEGEGFININNNETYSGVQTDEMTVLSAEESMNGFKYRCIVSGKCAPVTSDEAILNVRLRTAQHITFEESKQVTYGADDFAPDGISDAGLDITYTSSDNGIATIINGKIHIKQVGEVTITASQAGNNDYKPATSVNQVLTIGKKDITVTINATPAISKVYDGYSSASLVSQNYTLNGVVGSDDVYAEGEAKYDDSKAGNDKHITTNNFVLKGEQKGNYTLTTASADVTGSISRKEISVTLNATPEISKTYDGSKNATLVGANYSIAGLIGEDNVTVSGNGSYDDKNVGGDKTITVNNFELQGNDKDNYKLVTTSATTAGSIGAKAITASVLSQPAISKTYDGNNIAHTVAANYSLQGIVEGDDVSVSSVAIYDNRHAGDDKTVTLTDFVLNGEDKNNYSLETSEAVATGSITKKALTVTILGSPVITKQYDGNTNATITPENYSVSGIVGEDMVVLNNPSSGTYDTKHGGTNKKVTVTGLEISGEDAGDYTLESTTARAEVGTITKKAIVVSAKPQTKVYGSADPVLAYTTEGKLEDDELAGSLGRAEGKHVGEYSINIGSLSGGDDYEIEDFNSSTLVITPAPLVIKADDKTKKQGTANPTLTFTYDGLAVGDVAADLDSLPVAVTNATTGSPIGSYDIKAKGAASHDYTISYADGKLIITPAGDESYSLKVWSSSPDVIQVRIYSAVAQKAAIILYTEVGQKVIIQQKQLSAGINSYTLHVGYLASSTYVLGVAAEKFKDAQKVKVK